RGPSSPTVCPTESRPSRMARLALPLLMVLVSKLRLSAIRPQRRSRARQNGWCAPAPPRARAGDGRSRSAGNAGWGRPRLIVEPSSRRLPPLVAQDRARIVEQRQAIGRVVVLRVPAAAAALVDDGLLE